MVEQFIPFGKEGFFDVLPCPERSRNVVYIIDSMACGLQFVAGALHNAGYNTSLHATLEDFAASFRKEWATAIFVEVRLGAEDAMDVLDFLHEQRASTDLYLISSDPDALTCTRNYAAERGMPIMDVLRKPFTGKQLLDLIGRCDAAVEETIGQIDISDSFKKGWIEPALQPKMNLSSGRIVSAELLTRIRHPEIGKVPTQTFIDNLTCLQSFKLFAENLKYARRNLLPNFIGNESGFTISINVSLQSIVPIVERIDSIGTRVVQDFNRIVLEITEESASKLSASQMKALFKLHLRGARFSIDDFGIGHSNFSRLARLPVHEIKIDRSLVQGCAATSQKQIIIRTIISMSHELGAEVVAEGVETLNDLTWLREAGCDAVQGYIVGCPMKPERFLTYARQFW